MKQSHKSLSCIVAILSAVLFFYLAFSTWDVWFKAGIIIAELIVTGFIIHKLTGIEHYYGFLMVRGFAGLNLMEFLAKKWPELARVLADFGFSLGFGFVPSVLVFGRDKVKCLFHFAFVVAFMFLLDKAGLLGAFGSGGWALYAGIIFGLAGLGFMGIFLHAVNVLTVPNTPPGVSLLLPGVTVPWEAIFAIAIIAIVHEMAHGVLSYVEGIKLKSSGILLFGFLPVGAFVEPDEQRLEYSSIVKKRRILVAGSTSNAFFFIAFLLLSLPLAFLTSAAVGGLVVTDVSKDSSAYGIVASGDSLLSADGIKLSSSADLIAAVRSGPDRLNVSFSTANGTRTLPLLELQVLSVNKDYPVFGQLVVGERLLSANGVALNSVEDLRASLKNGKEGSVITFETSRGEKKIALGKGGKLGIELAAAPLVSFDNKPKPGFELIYPLLAFLLLIVTLTYLFNFLVAVVNLLPIFMTDGHKIIYYEFEQWIGKAAAMKLSLALGILTVGILFINALPWFFK